MTPRAQLFESLLRDDARQLPASSFEDFWPRVPKRGGSFERAVLGGFVADRVGYAFAAGIQAAAGALVCAPDPPRVLALCATEERGGHPRDIETRLDAGRLTGKKRWVTLALDAEILFVVASVGKGESGRNRLTVARIGARAPGVSMTKMPDPPFCPEIRHAEIVLAAAAVDEVLEGDGFDRYLRPFRTVEDIHVLAAIAAYLAGAARSRHWPPALVEDLVALVAVLGTLADLDPSHAAGHVALAGALRTAERMFAACDAQWAEVHDDVSDRWTRDRGILGIAARARDQRLASAWRSLGSSGSYPQ